MASSQAFVSVEDPSGSSASPVNDGSYEQYNEPSNNHSKNIDLPSDDDDDDHLATRTTSLIDTYRDYINHAHENGGGNDEEMNLTSSDGGDGVGGIYKRSSVSTKVEDGGGNGPLSLRGLMRSCSGGDSSASTKSSSLGHHNRDASQSSNSPLLSGDWTNTGTSIMNNRTLDLDYAFNDDASDGAPLDTTGVGSMNGKRYRYTHPIYHSKKFKSFVACIVGGAAIVAWISATSSKKHKKNEFKSWGNDIELKKKEEMEKKPEPLVVGIQDGKDPVTYSYPAVEASPSVSGGASSSGKDKWLLKMLQDGMDDPTKELNLDMFCGSCQWEGAKWNCDFRVEYLMQHHHMTEEGSKISTMENGDCIDPEADPKDLWVSLNENELVQEEAVTVTEGKEVPAIHVNTEKEEDMDNQGAETIVDEEIDEPPVNVGEENEDGESEQSESNEDNVPVATSASETDSNEADEQIVEEDATQVNGKDLPLEAFCGSCQWEGARWNCDFRVQFLMDHYHMTEEGSKRVTLDDGDCIDPDYFKGGSSPSAVTEVASIEMESEPIAQSEESSIAAQSIDEGEPEESGTVLPQPEEEGEAEGPNPTQAQPEDDTDTGQSKPVLSQEEGDIESVTSHLLCCSFSFVDSVPTINPAWYTRSDGWVGTTYQEAISFCSDQGGETQLCDYDEYCPDGLHNEPLGGHRGADDFDASSYRAPISDYTNGWVQVGVADSCVQYTMLPNTPETASALELDELFIEDGESKNNNPIDEETGGQGGETDESEEEESLQNYDSDSNAAVVAQEPVQPDDESDDGQAQALTTEVVIENPPALENPLPKEDEQQQVSQHEKEASEQEVEEKATLQQQEPAVDSANTATVDVTSILHETFKPLWLSSSDGWNGGTYAQANQFCESVHGKKLCPYSAMCPQGPGNAVMGGRKNLEFEVVGEQYAPISGSENGWVMIGTTSEGDKNSKCMTHQQLTGRAPEWGLSLDKKELKQHIMCCTVG